MKRPLSTFLTLLLFSSFLIFNLSLLKAQTLYYVDQDASGNNTGLSWNDAMPSIQSAIETAVTGDSIWVAQGIYKPSKDITGNSNPIDPRTKTFYINKNIKIWGGFTGTENNLTDRNPFVETILSGDTGIEGDSLDNAYTLLFIDASTSSTHLTGELVIDNFNFTNGNSDNTRDNSASSSGAGIYLFGDGNNNLFPTISNCNFYTNIAKDGGSVFVKGNNGAFINPSFQNCIFSMTDAIHNGGAISCYAEGGSNIFLNIYDSFGSLGRAEKGGFLYGTAVTNSVCSLSIRNSTIQTNFATINGGAIALEIVNSSGGIDGSSVIFDRNAATLSGGAVDIVDDGIFSGCFFSESTFENNSVIGATGKGGAISYELIESTVGFFGGISNSKFINNSAYNTGAVLLENKNSGSATSFNCINSLFDRNIATLNAGAFTNSGFTSTVTNCTFSKNVSTNTSGSAILNDGSETPNTIELINTIIWDNTPTDGQIDATSTINVQSSLLGDGLADGSISYFNNPSINDDPFTLPNLDSNPKFENETSFDYRLSNISPVINRADGANNYPYDLDKTTRKIGHRIDMGAYERIEDTIVWLGLENTDWRTPNNWNYNRTPILSDDVLILLQTNKPIVNTGDAISVKSLTLSENAELTVEEVTLNVAND